MINTFYKNHKVLIVIRKIRFKGRTLYVRVKSLCEFQFMESLKFCIFIQNIKTGNHEDLNQTLSNNCFVVNILPKLKSAKYGILYQKMAKG